MKVLLVNGSPKANGNTARALAEVAEHLNAEGIDTEAFNWAPSPFAIASVAASAASLTVAAPLTTTWSTS